MSRRIDRRMADARERAYAAHEELARAVRRGAHRLRVEQTHARAVRAWREGARLHRWRDAAWCAVARWHVAMLRHGVLDAGCPVPQPLPRGIDTPWPGVPRGVQWLHRAGLPHYGCEKATMIDGSRWVPSNGYYVEVVS